MRSWVPFLWALIQVIVLIISYVLTSQGVMNVLLQIADEGRSYSTLTSIL